MKTASLNIRDSLRVLWKKIKYIGVGTIALLSAMLAGKDKISEFLESELPLYFYYLIDLWKVEIVFILVSIIIFPHVRVVFNQCWVSITENRDSLSFWLRTSGWVLSCLFLIALIGYQGAYYFKGKQLRLGYYNRSLLSRADEAFLEGKMQISKIHLRVCDELLKSYRCKELISELENRKKMLNFSGNFIKRCLFNLQLENKS